MVTEHTFLVRNSNGALVPMPSLEEARHYAKVITRNNFTIAEVYEYRQCCGLCAHAWVKLFVYKAGKTNFQTKAAIA